MSDFTLYRVRHDDHATLGALYQGGDFLCYTLENRPPKNSRVKEPGLSRIPAGTYPFMERDAGGFFQRYNKKWPGHGPMVEIKIPNWSAVLIHIGNYHTDTAGCILLGYGHGEHQGALSVWSSTDAYRDLLPQLQAHARVGGNIHILDEEAAPWAGS